MSKLKTAKRKVKHLRKAYHRLIIDNNKMVNFNDVHELICKMSNILYPKDEIRKAINDIRLERSKNALYEHCIQPYSDTTREEFEVEYQKKFGGVKQNFRECEAREQHCPSEFNEYFHDNLSSMLSRSENE
jgi:hypothetical protein